MYPEPLREIIPYLQGEVCELRSNFQTFHHLFISDAERTKLLGVHIAGLLGSYQNLLQDEMLVSIARLTDADSQGQKNLSFRSLAARSHVWDQELGMKVKTAVNALVEKASGIRTHRHKRLAHYDLSTSFGQSELPTVTYNLINQTIKLCENILNLVSQAIDGSTMMFEVLDHRDITDVAEITVYKAAAYDAAVETGKLDYFAWRQHVPRTSGK